MEVLAARQQQATELYYVSVFVCGSWFSHTQLGMYDEVAVFARVNLVCLTVENMKCAAVIVIKLGRKSHRNVIRIGVELEFF